MIAAAMISKSMVWVPLNFVYACGWSSDLVYGEFVDKAMFVRAFDAVLNVIPEFGADI
jgi:hypothetical protein